MEIALFGNSWLKANKPLRKGNLCNLLKKIFQFKKEKIFYHSKSKTLKYLRLVKPFVGLIHNWVFVD